MLTKEIIQANAELASLTDEQISALETLSQNDENAVIGSRLGEIYRQMDATIATATGIERNGDEKTYLYLERATKALADKANESDRLAKEVLSLTSEKSRLEKVIAEGGNDAETQKALKQAQKDLVAISKQFTDLKAEYDGIKDAHAKEIFGIQFNGEVAKATSGIKFKAELPESVQSVLISQVVGKIKEMHPEYIDDGKGGQTLAFKDESGAVLRNPENSLNPYTIAEMINKELKEMDVLSTTPQRSGGGTKPTNTGRTDVIDLSGAKTQGEAMNIVTSQLMQKGIARGSQAFQKAVDDAWETYNIKSLPRQ